MLENVSKQNSIQMVQNYSLGKAGSSPSVKNGMLSSFLPSSSKSNEKNSDDDNTAESLLSKALDFVKDVVGMIVPAPANKNLMEAKVTGNDNASGDGMTAGSLLSMVFDFAKDIIGMVVPKKTGSGLTGYGLASYDNMGNNTNSLSFPGEYKTNNSGNLMSLPGGSKSTGTGKTNNSGNLMSLPGENSILSLLGGENGNESETKSSNESIGGESEGE